MYVSEFGCQQFEKRYELHRTIMRAFPKTLGNNERVLFRLDANERSVLVQSVGLPDWLWFPGRVTVKEFQPQFQIGRMHCFQLHANPTVKRGGKRVGLYREEEQLAWLKRKACLGGFTLVQINIERETIIEDHLYRNRKRHNLKFIGVEFSGVLRVANPLQLLETVKRGVGSGKGFGFGLLWIKGA